MESLKRKSSVSIKKFFIGQLAISYQQVLSMCAKENPNEKN
jgi:hypothetical protein